jgi:DNA repair ATPase RecN
MAKMSKIDRMNDAESIAGEDSLSDIPNRLQEVLTAVEEFEERRATVESSLNDAASYHEDREWDARNDSLDEANTAVEEMGDLLGTIEENAEILGIDDERMEGLNQMVEKLRSHLSELIEG